MSELILYAGTFIAGLLLGMLFFGGLWLTLNGLERSRHPALRLLSSLLLRVTLVLIGFYAIAQLDAWQHLLTALAGFIASRWWMTRRLRAISHKSVPARLTHSKKETMT